MNKRFFQGLPPVLGSHHIPFEVTAVVSKKVYIPQPLIVFFHNVNVLVKVLTLLFNQISTILWKIIQVWLQKIQFDWHSHTKLAETLQEFFNFLIFYTPVVSQGICNYWLQLLPARQFSFAQYFIKHWVLCEFSYLRAIKYTSLEFLHAYLWEFLLEESKPAAFPVCCFQKVLHYS